jgi:hypothetical protein
VKQPPLFPDPAEEPDAPDDGRDDAPKFAMARPVAPEPFEMPSFPAVLSENPDER